MSRAKGQGTRHESWCVQLFQNAGYFARRIAEGGSKDEGDLEVLIYGQRYVGEAKARQALSPQTALSKARKKANGAPTFVVWKRLTKKPGNQIRTPVAGEPHVLLTTPQDWLDSLERAYQAGYAAAYMKEHPIPSPRPEALNDKETVA